MLTKRPPRRRLLLFRAVKPGVVDFLLNHVYEHEQCLRLDFDVKVVGGECDYDEMCDRYEPDVALFEFGVDSTPFQITRLGAHPQVPKIGFLHCDAYDNARAAFVAQMEYLGAETLFTHSVAMGEYFPELAPMLFYWPNFVDPDVFYPYDVDKTIPILVTGSQIPLYPWRNRVIPEVTAGVPSFVCPHPGWGSQSRATVVRYVGSDYARLLSRSSIVPACGSMTKDVVRKHFEIPAAGSCLLTEDTASVRAAGFEDMRNCVFAEAGDVVDKVEYLLTNADELASIVAAGRDLVRTRHTMVQRGQVAQWLDAYLARDSTQSIIQDGPFGRVRLSDAPFANGSPAVISNGVDRALLVAGWASLADGDAAAATEAFARAIGYFDVPEAEVGLAWAALHLGDVQEAKARIDALLDQYFSRFGDIEPDPVQWATRIRALLCSGDIGDATRAVADYPLLAHPELRRLRTVLAQLSGRLDLVSTESPPDRVSVVRLPDRAESEWLADLAAMLRACGRTEWASALVADGSGKPGVRSVPIMGASYRRTQRRRISVRALDLARRTRAWLPEGVLVRGRRYAYTDPRHDVLLDAVNRRPGRALYVVGSSRFDRWASAVIRRARRNPYLREVRRVQLVDLASWDLTDAFVYLAAEEIQKGINASTLLACQVVIVNGANTRAGLRLLTDLRRDARLRFVAGVPDEGNGVVILGAVRPADMTLLPGYAACTKPSDAPNSSVPDGQHASVKEAPSPRIPSSGEATLN